MKAILIIFAANMTTQCSPYYHKSPRNTSQIHYTMKCLNASSIIITLFSLIFLTSSCDKKKTQEVTKVDEGFKEYVSGFTSGVISSKDVITIKLTSQHKQDVKSGDALDAKAFSFTPTIKGKAYWANGRTIEFKPDEPLPSATKYEGQFALSSLIQTSATFKSFPMKFQVVKQSFQVKQGELLQNNTADLGIYKYTGTVISADHLDNDKAELLLKAKYLGNDLAIEWQHDNSKTHRFVVTNIKRQETDTEMQLSWDGKTAGIDNTGSTEVEIPGLNNFKLISAQVFHQPSQYVLLTFSDPLDRTQNLEGLIKIKNENKLKFTVEDNQVKVYLNTRIAGERKITVENAIKNTSGYKLKSSKSQELTFEATKPNVRLIGKGIIIPNSNGLIFPFEAVNLNAVDLKIIKIYEDNVAQFLQVNALDGNNDIRRVGRLIATQKVDLISDNLIDYGRWNAFSFDLAKLIESEPGAIYKIEISFRKSYSLYPCNDETNYDENEEIAETNWDVEENAEQSYWDDGAYYYDYSDDYNWYDRENPCTPSYYRNKKVSRNILASDLGIIAKTSNNKEMKVVVTNLLTAMPISNVDVDIVNYQQQLIATAKTDNKGIATIPYDMKPFLLIAKSGDQRGYLKLTDGTSLSLSKFDVGGAHYDKGIKGFIYGERGVWRPGDDIFLSFILEDKENLLPEEHPVSFELINPMGKTEQRIIKSSSLNGFYSFNTKTKDDAYTGNWMARIKVGGATFIKNIKIETVKPNRLKINLDFGKDIIKKNDKTLEGKMEVKWLHGAIAKSMEAEVDVELVSVKTTFPSFSEYIFDNPSITFSTVEKRVFSGNLNEKGIAMINPDVEIYGKAPGMLKAIFNTKVFEEGGNFSVNQISIPYAPYSTFVGVKLPKGDKTRGMLLTDKKHKVEVVTVDENGKPVSSKNLVGKLYKVEWRWWWQSGSDNIGSYIKRNKVQPISSKTFSTTDGFGSFNIEVKYPDWGRYIVVVETPGGHSTGKTVYIDWPGWAGRAQDENSGGASMLSFSSDKPGYTVGEMAKISMPSSANGRALVSIEKGSKVLEMYWVDTQKEQTEFEFTITENMAPNAYVNITMLQAHAQTANDLPIRLYGVIPIMVEDPQTKLQPVITMPEELKPESQVNIKISEKDGRPMTFTVAVVDEGLLDLTNYRTPSPWNTFYAREALSVKSWDLYDFVLGAYGAKIEGTFAIGGDGDANNNKSKKARRFKPVVKYFGPFSIDKGESKEVSFEMPRYIGSVKTMVVAANDGAYGTADKATPVKNPLMLFATLPRVLSPSEKVKLPVTLFALDDRIKEVTVKIKTNDLIKIVGDDTRTITFNKAGETDFNFDVEAANAMGVAKIELTAKSGKETATYEIEMEVRAPNPKRITTYSTVVKSKETWEQVFEKFGIDGSNSATLEVSGMPPINMNSRLKYLIRYPYGCIEQTTSSAFPQLYLSDVVELNKQAKKAMKVNVEKAIERLSSFQLSNGGMSYWPGNSTANEWGTNYAGHFLIEAEEKGYSLPINLKESWLEYQRESSNNWTPSTNYYRSYGMTQAYRLYTLALAGEANLGAMNRLKEYEELCVQGSHYLAMSYLFSGNSEAALEIIHSAGDKRPNVKSYYRTYGSSDRDLAILLETLITMKMYDEAMPIIKEVSDILNSKKWMSTQSTAYCLRAMSKAAEVFKASLDEFKYSYVLNKGKSKDVMSTSLVNQYDIAVDDNIMSNTIKLTNDSPTPFYVNLSVEGIPLVDEGAIEKKNLEMTVSYKTMTGATLDHASIDQGTDFKMEVSIKHLGTVSDVKDIALSAMLPSGWEIINTRLNGSGDAHAKDLPDYLDIRDDRVNLFFDLGQHQTKTFVILLNASYLGEYNMPAIQCAAMYNNDVRARIPGQKVSVVKPAK